MSAKGTASLNVTALPSPTASHGDLQTSAGYANWQRRLPPAPQHTPLRPTDLQNKDRASSHVCRHLALEATRRSGGYAANADFFEKDMP